MGPARSAAALSPIEPESPYETTGQDFAVLRTGCQWCGGPIVGVNWIQPDQARRQNIWKPTASFTQRYGPLYLKERQGRPCRRCLIRQEIQRVTGGYMPDRYRTVVDPAQEALRKLQAEINPPKLPPDCLPDGSTFQGGQLFITRPAAQAILRCNPMHVEIPGLATIDVPDEVKAPYLAAHASEANTPKLAAKALELAHFQGPFATQEEQNAVAVADGVGTIRSRHPLYLVRPWGCGRTDPHGRPADPGAKLFLWTELGDLGSRIEDNRKPVTFAYLGSDGVSTD